jgi:SAM-dependent methyltransferase
MFLKISIRFYRWWQSQKNWLWQRWTRWPPIGAVDFGDLRRLTPFSRNYGLDRGLPIDRYYIEKFLEQFCQDIRGRALEIGDPRYIRKFGGEQVLAYDVLHVSLRKPEVTIIADLTRASQIPSDHYDCIILTQTIQYIYNFAEAIKTIYRILKPGGVLLATFPGCSQVVHPNIMENWEDYWRFTSRSAQRIFAEVFPPEQIATQTYGNVLVVTASLYGLAAGELSHEALDYHDPDYQVLIGVKAIKPSAVNDNVTC